jgi:hypothetical protein
MDSDEAASGTRAPSRRAGSTVLPSFIVGGAPRSGTTWLHAVLDRHPSVYMAGPVKPEPKFFLVDEEYAKGFPYYLDRWFSRVPSGAVAGEKSTNYLESATAAERIHLHLPGVRMVFILRDPVERAFSNYLWSRMNGMETEDLAIALDLEPDRERTCPPALRYARPHAYFSRGLYADLLEPWFARFPRDRLLCLRLEDVLKDAGAVVARLHRFVGVEPRPGDAEGVGPINPAERGEIAFDPRVRRRLEEAYRPANERLSRLLGPDFDVWSYGP